MRKPSRGSVVILILTPIIGCLLLWHVVFPLVDSEGDIHDLLSWKASKELNYSEDGYLREESESSGGGFSEMPSQSTAGNKNTGAGSSGSSNVRSSANGPAADYTVSRNEVTSAPVNNESSAAVHRPASNNNGNAHDDTRTDNVQSTAEKLAAVASAAEQMKRAGEQVKDIKKGKDDQSKIGSGVDLLLPPDEGDPVDVPIDGGLSVLLAGALGYGAKKAGMFKRKKTNDKNS